MADAYFEGRLGGAVNVPGGMVERSIIRWAGKAIGRPVLVVLAVLVTASAVVSVGVSQPVSAAGVPLRQVDWITVLMNDPAVTVDPTAYSLPGAYKPFVDVAAPRAPGGSLSGYALVDDVLYGDLDGNGSEEAIVLVDSGGTGGLLGFLLYREAEPTPGLVLARTGYKLGVAVEGNKLVIHEPNYVGFEANCCPSSTTRTLNVLEGDRLVTLATEVEPNDVQEPTVWSYYMALAEKRYEDAYEFHSPAYQAANPFGSWKSGFANTQRIEVETSAGHIPSEVLIRLTATDSRPGGGTVTQRFTGAWSLIWSAEKRRWLLDTASIQLAWLERIFM